MRFFFLFFSIENAEKCYKKEKGRQAFFLRTEKADKHHGSFCAGDSAAGKLIGVLVEGTFDLVAGPKGKDQAGDYKNQIGHVEAIIE